MGEQIVKKVKSMSWTAKISLMLICTICFSVFMYNGWYKPSGTQAAPVTYNIQANSGTTVATGISTNVSCGSNSSSARTTLMSTASQSCSSNYITLSGTGTMLEAYLNTAYTSAKNVNGTSFNIRLRDSDHNGWQAGIQLFYVTASGTKTNFSGAEVTQSISSGRDSDYVLSLSGQSATVPAGSKLGIRVRAISGSSSGKRVYWGNRASTTSGKSGMLTVDEVTDATPPQEGALSVSPQSGSYVPSSFTITGTFTDNESAVSSCQYTLNGGTTWSSGTVSGTGSSYTCTANITGQANGAALVVNMRATSSGGTSAYANPLSVTVDAAAPADGVLTVSPGANQNGLSWTSASDSGSGLAASDTYEIVFQTGSTPPANCNSGTQIYVGVNPTFAHTGLTNGATYSYRVCAYDNLSNMSSGATGSGTPVNNPNITKAGTCTAAQASGTSISVSMPYEGDADGDSRYTVEYKLSSSSLWTTWISNAAHTTSPYAAVITGLTEGQRYDVRCSFNDADGISGSNSQIIAGIVLTNTLLHNSVNTGSTKWGAAGWGIAGGKYGAIVCGTCHEPRASNIKGIKALISASNGIDQFPGQAGGVSVSFQSLSGANRLGDDSISYASSTKICEYCHSQTSVHKYNQSAVALHETPINMPDCTNCHRHDQGFKPSGGCTICHAVQVGARVAVVSQFSGNSHHVQGIALTDKHCYQCHWEANSDGSINSAYHGGSGTPGSKVDLVIYGTGTRPTTYVAGTTAVEYVANSSRAEIQKINQHCLGCHSLQNNTAQPFNDGKTPKQYAWDSMSINDRYSQAGTTTWGKYSGANVTPKNTQKKAFSAHGNAANNQRGWNLTETWPNTAGTVNISCFDCHNSHGSTVSGATTSYASATPNGGILKDTTAGKGGYAMAYKPQAGGSATTRNVYTAGAAICFDCHLTQNAGTRPWGYQGTFGATQVIMGYFDTQYFGSGKTGPQQRYAYKASAGQPKGGHFGVSSSLTTQVMGTIGGLCTPCHDPHGISPTIGANQAYAVPLLKGTWMTSPYKEDAAPLSKTESRGGGDSRSPLNVGSTPGYYIDQNTFETLPTTATYTWNFNSTKRITETADQFAGLCLRCHPKSSIAPGANSTWKSVDRIHNTVQGWGTFGANNNNAVHSYTCSKCHAPHNSALNRLMVTNCLDFTHRGRVVSGGTVTQNQQTDSDNMGRGNGRFPAGGGGYGREQTVWGNGKGGSYFFGIPGTSGSVYSGFRQCHDAANAAETWPAGERWNIKTPW